MSNGKAIVSGQLEDGSIAIIPLKTLDNKTYFPVSIDNVVLPDGIYLPAQQYLVHEFGPTQAIAPALSANAVALAFIGKELAPGESESYSGINWDVSSAEMITTITAIDPLSVLTFNLYSNAGSSEVLVATWVPSPVLGSATLFFVSPFAITSANLEQRACFPLGYRLEAVVSGTGAGVTFDCGIVRRDI